MVISQRFIINPVTEEVAILFLKAWLYRWTLTLWASSSYIDLPFNRKLYFWLFEDYIDSVMFCLVRISSIKKVCMSTSIILGSCLVQDRVLGLFATETSSLVGPFASENHIPWQICH